MSNNRTGSSLVELMVTVVVIAAMAAVAVPRVNFAIATGKGVSWTSKKIATDLRRTRQLAISDAATNTSGFELRMNGSSPYASYDIVNLGTSEVVDSHTISSDVSCVNGSGFKFGPMGNLLSGSDSGMDISGGNESITLTIISATGMVKCVEN